MEVTLTTKVLPSAKLRRNMTHSILLSQLYSANADSPTGRQMISHLMDDVKIMYFDGAHTIKFVFNSRRIANLYLGCAFRLNGTYLEIEDSESGPLDGTYRMERL